MSERDPKIRVYPVCCTSAFCGRVECDGCPNLPVKREFEEWRERTSAIVEDKIWCPSVYTAQK